jgi:hypothetical protein
MLGFPLAAIVLLAGCATPGTPGAAPAPARVTGSAPPACPEAGIVIRAGVADAASGLRVLPVELVNCGSRPYTVNGFPAVRVLDDDRKPLAVTVGDGSLAIAVVEGFDAAPKPVTLQPGEQAVAKLLWRNTYTDPTVTPVNGSYLDIAPAAGESWQTVTPGARIDLGNTGKLGVSAWTRSAQDGRTLP